MAKKSKSRKSAGKESPDGNELLLMELQQIHSAESQLARALPRFSKAVESETVREMLDQRLEEGERILKELETALDEMEESPGRKRNAAAEGLIGDAREHIQEIARGPALDAVLIAGPIGAATMRRVADLALVSHCELLAVMVFSGSCWVTK